MRECIIVFTHRSICTVEGWASTTNKSKALLRWVRSFKDGPRELVQETSVKNISKKVESLETTAPGAEDEAPAQAKSKKKGGTSSVADGILRT